MSEGLIIFGFMLVGGLFLLMTGAQVAHDNEARRMAKHDGREYDEYSWSHYFEYKRKLEQYGNADNYIKRTADR